MSSNRKYNGAAALLNTFIIISTIIVATIGVLYGAGEGQVGEDMRGAGYFKAFTNLSNILAAVCALVMLRFNIRNLKDDDDDFPRWAVLFYYTGASAVGLTFVIVLVFLGPMFKAMGLGYFVMFRNHLFYLHFLNPLLCGISFSLLQRKHVFGVRENIIAIIPTVLYSVVYAYMVVIAKKWNDFYNFTLGGHFEFTPMIMIVMYGISFLVAFWLKKLHDRSVANAENS